MFMSCRTRAMFESAVTPRLSTLDLMVLPLLVPCEVHNKSYRFWVNVGRCLSCCFYIFVTNSCVKWGRLHGKLKYERFSKCFFTQDNDIQQCEDVTGASNNLTKAVHIITQIYKRFEEVVGLMVHFHLLPRSCERPHQVGVWSVVPYLLVRCLCHVPYSCYASNYVGHWFSRRLKHLMSCSLFCFTPFYYFSYFVIFILPMCFCCLFGVVRPYPPTVPSPPRHYHPVNPSPYIIDLGHWRRTRSGNQARTRSRPVLGELIAMDTPSDSPPLLHLLFVSTLLSFLFSTLFAFITIPLRIVLKKHLLVRISGHTHDATWKKGNIICDNSTPCCCDCFPTRRCVQDILMLASSWSLCNSMHTHPSRLPDPSTLCSMSMTCPVPALASLVSFWTHVRKVTALRAKSHHEQCAHTRATLGLRTPFCCEKVFAVSRAGLRSDRPSCEKSSPTLVMGRV